MAKNFDSFARNPKYAVAREKRGKISTVLPK